MSDYIRLPRSALDKVKSALHRGILVCLLEKVDGNGCLTVSIRAFANEIDVSYQTLRTALAKLTANAVINATPTQGLTQRLTQITICNFDSYPTSDSKPQRNLQRKPNAAANAVTTAVSPIVQDGFSRFLIHFNEKVANTPIKQIRTLSEARKNALRSIFRDFGGKEIVEEALDKVVSSRWCCGENDKGWVATFDWIFKKSNFIKILEGNYDNRTLPTPAAADNAATRKAQRDRGLSLATQIVAGSENLLNLFNGGGQTNPDTRQD